MKEKTEDILVEAGAWLFVILLVMVILCSCTTTKYVPVEKTITEVVTNHDTTIVVKLKHYTDSVIVYADTAKHEAKSHLENEYCESSAIYTNGKLKHTLNVKPNAVDTVVVTKVKNIVKTIREPQIVEVEKKLSTWDKFIYWLQGMGILIFLVLVGLMGVSIWRVSNNKDSL